MCNQEEKYFLGIDLGTSTCKICAMDKRGKVVDKSFSSYQSYSPYPGWVEQNPKDWIKAVSEASINLINNGIVDKNNIFSITLTSAAHIGVLTDTKNEPVRNSIIWSDQRSKKEAEELRIKYGEQIMNCTSNNVSTSWTLPHLVWIRENEPEKWKLKNRISLSKDYLLHWLTGEWKTDPGTAISSMLCDSSTKKWSDWLCDIAEIEKECLPKIASPNEIVGTLLSEVAKILNLPPGIPVINGSLDSATETYGANALKEGEYVIRIGTAGGIHVLNKSKTQNPKLLTYPYLTNNLCYSQAGTNSAGSAIAWAVRMLNFSNTPDGYNLFDKIASKAPAGSDGVLFHPYLAGERTPYWDSSLKGTFSGISFLNKKEHFARAVIEGVVFSLFDAFLALTDRDSIPNAVRVVGGGTESSLLLSILSATINRKLIVVKNIDSAYGAALYGLRSSGIININTEQTLVENIVVPDKTNVALYNNVFINYQLSCKHLQEMYHDCI